MQHNIALREYKTRLGVIYCFRYVFYFAIIPVETHGRASLQSPVCMDTLCVHTIIAHAHPKQLSPCMFQQLSRCVRTNIPIRVPEINPVRVQTIIIVHISTIIPIHPCKCSRMFR